MVHKTILLCNHQCDGAPLSIVYNNMLDSTHKYFTLKSQVMEHVVYSVIISDWSILCCNDKSDDAPNYYTLQSQD
jgi:(2Fe-2S) ferredoxin